MILFPTFNNVLLLFMFVYLGLASGFVFNFVNKLSTIIKYKVDKKVKIQTEIKKTKTPIFSKFKIKLIKNKKNSAPAEQVKHDSEDKIRFVKFKPFLSNAFKFVSKCLANGLNIITLLVVVFISFLINLNLNFGCLRPIYVALWIIFFFVGKSLFNLLANYLTNFYNWLSKRIKKDGRAKQ